MSAPARSTGDVGLDELDSLIRRVDPDRWLASRFIGDEARRRSVIGIYALNDELARVGESVSQSLAGEIRLAWWRDRIDDLYAGRAGAAHPVLQALAPDIASGRLPREPLEALIEARHADLEARPFADDAALAPYLDGTAGAVMAMAARVLDPASPLRAVVEAGRAWALAGLLRARSFLRDNGRDWVPVSWGDITDDELRARVRVEVERALAVAKIELKVLPVAAFPAVAYAALARPYGRGRQPSEVEKRLRLLHATLLGQV